MQLWTDPAGFTLHSLIVGTPKGTTRLLAWAHIFNTANSTAHAHCAVLFDLACCFETYCMHCQIAVVCRFQLRALPGHSKAGQKVTFGVLKGGRFKDITLVRISKPEHWGDIGHDAVHMLMLVPL